MHHTSGGYERVSSNSAGDSHRSRPGRRAHRWAAGQPATQTDDGGRGTLVPHVVGHHIDLALRMLGELGLGTRVLTTEVHDKTDRHVVSTQPAAGTPAERGHVVEVVMGIAPTVADYLGHDADDAVRLAETAGHVVETVLADPSRSRQTTDVVIAQEPDAGERSRVVLLRVGPPTPT
jgi:beta-lactam-binding protein with PASTA domain